MAIGAIAGLSLPVRAEIGGGLQVHGAGILVSPNAHIGRDCDLCHGVVLADTEAAISSAGSIVSDHDWGTRGLAYEIRHRTDAEYHLLQFHGPATLLANLQRSLRIADGVLRFRIVKLAPGTPAPTELPRAEAPAAAPAPAAERPPAPAPEAAEAEAEAPSAA